MGIYTKKTFSAQRMARIPALTPPNLRLRPSHFNYLSDAILESQNFRLQVQFQPPHSHLPGKHPKVISDQNRQGFVRLSTETLATQLLRLRHLGRPVRRPDITVQIILVHEPLIFVQELAQGVDHSGPSSTGGRLFEFGHAGSQNQHPGQKHQNRQTGTPTVGA